MQNIATLKAAGIDNISDFFFERWNWDSSKPFNWNFFERWNWDSSKPFKWNLQSVVTFKTFPNVLWPVLFTFDDGGGGKLFLCYGWQTKSVLALFPAGIIVREPHHCESPTRHEQDLNLHRTWVQALLNEVVITTTRSRLFFPYTSTLLFCHKIRSCCDRCFPQQIRPQITVPLYITRVF